MKKTNFMRKLFTAFTLVAFAAMTMVSCTEKENDPITPVDPNNPDTPEEPVSNYHFVLGSDSLKIDAVQIASMGDMFGTGEMDMAIVYLSNAMALECLYPASDEDSITVAFADIMTVLFSGNGCYGAVLNLKAEDEGDDMASGTFTLVKVDQNKSRLVVNGTTASGVAVDVLYEGGIIDADHPTGTGSFTVDGKTFDLAIAMLGMDNGVYAYSIGDATLENSVNIQSVTRLNGTANISADEDEVAAGNAVAVNVGYVDAEAQESVDFDITNGTITTAVNGQEYTITFNGTVEDGTVSGSYTGKIFEVFTDNLAKRMQAKIAKAMKK